MTHLELRVLKTLLNGALLRCDDLLMALDRGSDPREIARCALKAFDLAEEGIKQVKTPVRKLIRKNSPKENKNA